MKASDDEIKDIEIHIDSLSAHGSRRQTHMKLKRYVRIRQKPSKKVGKTFWELFFGSTKMESETNFGWWTEAHYQYKKAL